MAITSSSADDDEIMAFLRDRHPELCESIGSPPDFAYMLYEHAADTSGWETVGKVSGNVSEWSFWRKSLDLEHLRYLENKPLEVKPQQIAAPHNAFQALTIETDEPSISASDDGSESSDEDRDRSYDFMFHAPIVDDWAEETDSDASSANGAVIMPDAKLIDVPPTQPLRSAAVVIQDKKAFLEYFDLKQIPKVPTTSRKLSVLLDDNDAWDFSAEERLLVADYAARNAKDELDEEMLERFEVLAKRHEEARRGYAEAKDNVSSLRPIQITMADIRSASISSGRSSCLVRQQQVGEKLRYG